MKVLALWASLPILVLGHVIFGLTQATGHAWESFPPDACSSFFNKGLAWTHDDCMEVWTQFIETVPSGLRRRTLDVEMWASTAATLREANSLCMVNSTFTPDGSGSTTIRNLAAWIFSEEMGCDWLTPRWSGKMIGKGQGAAVLYCHRTATTEEFGIARTEKGHLGAALGSTNRCSVIDWLFYFQFNVPSVSWDGNGILKVIKVRFPMQRKTAYTREHVLCQLSLLLDVFC